MQLALLESQQQRIVLDDILSKMLKVDVLTTILNSKCQKVGGLVGWWPQSKAEAQKGQLWGKLWMEIFNNDILFSNNSVLVLDTYLIGILNIGCNIFWFNDLALKVFVLILYTLSEHPPRVRDPFPLRYFSKSLIIWNIMSSDIVPRKMTTLLVFL